MATIDLRTPEARAAFGLTDTTVSIPSRRFQLGRPERSRAESLAAIVEALDKASTPLTRAQIARAIERAKTPHLIGMINQLADAGTIAEIGRINKRGHLEFVYWTERRGGRR